MTQLGYNNSLAIHITANDDPVSSVASPKDMEDVGRETKPILPSLNAISYPVAPDQPMLTDRYSQRNDTRQKTDHSRNDPSHNNTEHSNNNLPNSL